MDISFTVTATISPTTALSVMLAACAVLKSRKLCQQYGTLAAILVVRLAKTLIRLMRS